MSGPNSAWWDGPGPNASFTLKVQRTGRPPLLWTWELVSDGGKADDRRSPRAYRSAEEAWAAGRAALAEIGRLRGPAR